MRFLYEPPFAFHEAAGDALVCILKIHPDTKPDEIFVHQLQEIAGNFLALCCVLTEAVCRNFILALKTKLFHDLMLSRQSMHVIASPIPYLEALHAPISQHTIFQRLVPCLAYVDPA